MVRSHGWGGNTPTSDEEALTRILDAADEIIADRGSAMRISDVARTLGVTRQTVYRYFPSTEALLLATAMRSGDGFLEHLASHVRGETDPVTAVIEGLAFAIENLVDDGRIGFILNKRSQNDISASLTSDTALTFSRSMLHRYEVDWEANGFDEDGITELAEFCLRLLYSFLVDNGRTRRGRAELRVFLARWVGPAVIYPRFAGAMDSLTKVSAPQRKRRRSAS
ncbi:TetR family transcriptional regulator [Mycobacterium triplex]|uniref:TetR family transcriptional regulator n=1 Tax=Mycobacterium triplex TaxID=47839 RepID=A0A024JZ80_9MYCO|nr:TetR/AcrR family transcriptional regulator [Mycobacterium triplex]ORX05099.1 TetR family transcriptional regulator [Mycobacterium triplex]CDO89110.1 TetR family transcriptional regulator [Mycobacterium triplex]